TLAPYLLHHFTPGMCATYARRRIQLKELRTQQITDYLRKDIIDVGIIALQQEANEFKTRPLFRERLLVFAPEPQSKLKSNYILSDDIDISKLWLLEEAHCIRPQVMNVCSFTRTDTEDGRRTFDAGSIESLITLVGTTKSITTMPELAVLAFTSERQACVKHSAEPEPARETGMIT